MLGRTFYDIKTALQLVTKIILSILFLVSRLFPMPYGYYELVRFIGMIGFSLLAYLSYRRNNQIGTVIYFCLALLFQPLIKIALGRVIWNIVDVIVAVALIASIFYKARKSL